MLKIDLTYLGTTSKHQGIVFFRNPRDDEARPFAFVAVTRARDKLDNVQLEFTELGFIFKTDVHEYETPATFLARVMEAIRSSVL